MPLQMLMLLTAAFLAAPAAGPASGNVLRGELAARYAAMKTAMANKDEAAIRSLLADGFVSVDVGGKSEDAADMVRDVLALPADPGRHSQTTIVSVKVDGRTALVEQRYEMTRKTTAPDGTEKSTALSTLSTDTWINDHGAWRIARTVTRKLDYTVDGRTIAHRENAVTP
jgi:hypothetical protein